MRLRLDLLFVSLALTLASVGSAVAEPLESRWQGAADLNGVALPMVNWHEATASGLERQQSVGSFYSTPLVKDGVIYIGSADGRLYALQ